MALSHYSRTQPGPEQTARARTTFQLLYRRQRLWTKLRFVLWAAFGKGCYTCLETQVKHETPSAGYSFAKKTEGKKPPKAAKAADPHAPYRGKREEAPPAPRARRRSDRNKEES